MRFLPAVVRQDKMRHVTRRPIFRQHLPHSPLPCSSSSFPEARKVHLDLVHDIYKNLSLPHNPHSENPPPPLSLPSPPPARTPCTSFSLFKLPLPHKGIHTYLRTALRQVLHERLRLLRRKQSHQLHYVLPAFHSSVTMWGHRTLAHAHTHTYTRRGSTW